MIPRKLPLAVNEKSEPVTLGIVVLGWLLLLRFPVCAWEDTLLDEHLNEEDSSRSHVPGHTDDGSGEDLIPLQGVFSASCDKKSRVITASPLARFCHLPYT